MDSQIEDFVTKVILDLALESKSDHIETQSWQCFTRDVKKHLHVALPITLLKQVGILARKNPIQLFRDLYVSPRPMTGNWQRRRFEYASLHEIISDKCVLDSIPVGFESTSMNDGQCGVVTVEFEFVRIALPELEEKNTRVYIDVTKIINENKEHIYMLFTMQKIITPSGNEKITSHNSHSKLVESLRLKSPNVYSSLMLHDLIKTRPQPSLQLDESITVPFSIAQAFRRLSLALITYQTRRKDLAKTAVSNDYQDIISFWNPPDSLQPWSFDCDQNEPNVFLSS